MDTDNSQHNIDIQESLATGRVQYLRQNAATISNTVTNLIVSAACLLIFYILIKQYLMHAEAVIEMIIIVILSGISLLPILGHLLNTKFKTIKVTYKANWPNIIENYFIETKIPIHYATNRIMCAQKDGGLTTIGRTWIVIFDGENILLNTLTLNKNNWPSTFNYLSNQRHLNELVRYINKNNS